MTAVAIHQPNYIPWPGFFYKIYQADIFVFLDDVQFSNTGLHNYHFIKTENGPVRLRVPVVQTLGDKIKEVKIRNDINWRKMHLDKILLSYSKAEYFNEVYNDFMILINEHYEYLQDLNISIICFICSKLGIKYNFLKSSELSINQNKEDKIIHICKAVGAKVYISGTGAKIYQNEANFTLHGIRLKYSEYTPFVYNQQYPGFQSNVSIIDYLMNCGYDWDKVIGHQKY